MKKEKIYNLLLFILIFANILLIILLNPIYDLDELWNYNFARNIANGLVPYKDFNMVVTPLLSIICGIILKFTFDELIVMRVIATLLSSTILIITYKIFNMLNIRKEISLLFIFIILGLYSNMFCLDYNFTTLLLVLLIIYIEIELYKKDNVFLKSNYKLDLFLGILAGLTITLKQTTGIFISLALLGNKLLFIRTKEELKIYFKLFVFRLIGIVFPVLIMLAYLIINNAIYDFVSYTIKGVMEFSNYIPYTYLFQPNLVVILAVLIPITIIYEIIKLVIYKKDKITYIFIIYGLAMLVVCFPISDELHLLIGIFPIFILILYELYNLIKKINLKISKKEKKIILLTINCIVISVLLCCYLINLYKYCNKADEYCSLNHFKYIPIDKRMEDQIKEIDNYIIKNDDVKILDTAAVRYMIPLDKYNKDYDMFNKGNFGFDGENRIIEEIKNTKNTKYLILKGEFEQNWQMPLNIINYIIYNKTKIGQIEIFDIYE